MPLDRRLLRPAAGLFVAAQIGFGGRLQQPGGHRRQRERGEHRPGLGLDRHLQPAAHAFEFVTEVKAREIRFDFVAVRRAQGRADDGDQVVGKRRAGEGEQRRTGMGEGVDLAAQLIGQAQECGLDAPAPVIQLGHLRGRGGGFGQRAEQVDLVVTVARRLRQAHADAAHFLLRPIVGGGEPHALLADLRTLGSTLPVRNRRQRREPHLPVLAQQHAGPARRGLGKRPADAEVAIRDPEFTGLHLRPDLPEQRALLREGIGTRLQVEDQPARRIEHRQMLARQRCGRAGARLLEPAMPRAERVAIEHAYLISGQRRRQYRAQMPDQLCPLAGYPSHQPGPEPAR